MLSQRMAKDYFAIGADIRPDIALKELDESVALFEQRILEVMDYAETHGLQMQVSELSEQWQNYRLDVLSKPDRQHASVLLKHSEELLRACNDTVAAISSQSSSPYVKLVALSEQETTLTQKIARDYYAMYWNVEVNQVRDDFKRSIDRFDQILKTLIDSENNPAEVQQLLDKVESQWKFSNAGFKLDESGHYVPNVISVTTDSIYKKMANIAYKYESLMAAN